MTKDELIELREKVLKMESADDIKKLLPQMSAYQYLHFCNDDRLDKYALNYLGRLYTFDELFTKVDVAAKAFSEKGVKAGDVIAMAMLTTPEAIISFYALNKIGATVYMVNATHEKHAIRDELLDSGAKLLLINNIFYDNDVYSFAKEANITQVVTSSLADSFPIGYYEDIVKIHIVNAIKRIGNACNKDENCISWKQFEKLGEESNLNVKDFYQKDFPMLISSTSGSTGKPKRPLLTNENINAMPVQMGMSCDAFAPGDSILTTLPIWIIYSLFNSIHEPLCLGVTVDLDPLFSSKKISKRLKQYKFNHWNTIPSYVEDMLRDKKMKNLDLSFIKTITTGGDYRTPKLKLEAEKLLKDNNSNCEIGQGYGLSETGGCFGYTYERNLPAESVGKPLVGNKYKILDSDSGKALGPNEIGELYLYSPALMKEYYKDTEATNKALVVDDDGITWYKTEDTAHYDEQGNLYLDGRLRRIEISRDGNGVPTKVFPDKIKQIVSIHPQIEKCEVIMVPDEKRISRPVAYLVLKDGHSIDSKLLNEINKICIENNLEKYTLPTEYISIDEIPKQASLKVDYGTLMDMYMSSNQEKSNSKVLSLFMKKRIS